MVAHPVMVPTALVRDTWADRAVALIVAAIARREGTAAWREAGEGDGSS